MRHKISSPGIFFLFILSSIVLIGCASKNRVGGMLNLDTDLTLDFQVASDINPNHRDRPSPLYVRLYQLNSPTAFEKADFVDLYEQDKELLGDDFINRKELNPFVPGERRTERFVLQRGTKYIGIFGEFSQYSDASYKVVFPVTENNVIRNKEIVKIAGKSIVLQKK